MVWYEAESEAVQQHIQAAEAKKAVKVVLKLYTGSERVIVDVKTAEPPLDLDALEKRFKTRDVDHEGGDTVFSAQLAAGIYVLPKIDAAITGRAEDSSFPSSEVVAEHVAKKLKPDIERVVSSAQASSSSGGVAASSAWSDMLDDEDLGRSLRPKMIQGGADCDAMLKEAPLISDHELRESLQAGSDEINEQVLKKHMDKLTVSGRQRVEVPANCTSPSIILILMHLVFSVVATANLETGLQLTVFHLLNAATAVLGHSKNFKLKDTSIRDFLRFPTHKIDITGFETLKSSWTTVTLFCELKSSRSTKHLHEVTGQIIRRAANVFRQQPKRRFVWALIISPEHVELVKIFRGSGSVVDISKFTFSWSGELSFTWEADSPGLKAVLRLMKAPYSFLGYTTPQQMPPIGGLTSGFSFAQGTGMTSGHIYKAISEANEEVAVKLQSFQSHRTETSVYQRMGLHKNMLRCIDMGDVEGADDLKYTVLSPWCQPLTDGNFNLLLVLITIGDFLLELAERNILHRGWSIDNIMIDPIDNTVKIIDYSSAKIYEDVTQAWSVRASETGTPENITEDMGFLSISTMLESTHSVSSEIESQFYIGWALACRSLDTWHNPDLGLPREASADRKSGFFSRQKGLPLSADVSQDCRAFIDALHKLIFTPKFEQGKVSAQDYKKLLDAYRPRVNMP